MKLNEELKRQEEIRLKQQQEAIKLQHQQELLRLEAIKQQQILQGLTHTNSLSPSCTTHRLIISNQQNR
jgi:hypothetical protein